MQPPKHDTVPQAFLSICLSKGHPPSPVTLQNTEETLKHFGTTWQKQPLVLMGGANAEPLQSRVADSGQMMVSICTRIWYEYIYISYIIYIYIHIYIFIYIYRYIRIRIHTYTYTYQVEALWWIVWVSRPDQSPIHLDAFGELVEWNCKASPTHSLKILSYFNYMCLDQQQASSDQVWFCWRNYFGMNNHFLHLRMTYLYTHCPWHVPRGYSDMPGCPKMWYSFQMVILVRKNADIG